MIIIYMIKINQPAGQKDEKMQQHVTSLKKKETQKLNIYYQFTFQSVSTAYRQLQYENIPI